jgi:hypothetical protein
MQSFGFGRNMKGCALSRMKRIVDHVQAIEKIPARSVIGLAAGERMHKRVLELSGLYEGHPYDPDAETKITAALKIADRETDHSKRCRAFDAVADRKPSRRGLQLWGNGTSQLPMLIGPNNGSGY